MRQVVRLLGILRIFFSPSFYDAGMCCVIPLLRLPWVEAVFPPFFLGYLVFLFPSCCGSSCSFPSRNFVLPFHSRWHWLSFFREQLRASGLLPLALRTALALAFSPPHALSQISWLLVFLDFFERRIHEGARARDLGARGPGGFDGIALRAVVVVSFRFCIALLIWLNFRPSGRDTFRKVCWPP